MVQNHTVHTKRSKLLQTEDKARPLRKLHVMMIGPFVLVYLVAWQAKSACKILGANVVNIYTQEDRGK